MKLASLAEGRDGRLVVVDRLLARAAHASAIAPTLQAALDDWSRAEPALRELSGALERDRVRSFAFDEAGCAAPLPRAYQWIDGSAYVNHVELLRRTRGEALPESFWREPLLYQGASDDLRGARSAIEVGDEAWGADFEAEVAVVTDDVAIGTRTEQAPEHIKLFVLANDVSFRALIPRELAKGFGFFLGKPATAFSPVAVTPDELDGALDGDAITLPLRVHLNDALFGRARPDVDRVFSFADLIGFAARTRRLAAGTIIGGGTVSNKREGAPGLPVAAGGDGYSCIAEQRAVEKLRGVEPRTPFLKLGDVVRIEMLAPDGASVFGRIEQTVVPYGPGVARDR